MVLGDRLAQDLGHGTAVLLVLVEELDGPVHVVGAEHDVDVGRPLGDALAVLLRQAAGDHDLHVGAPVLDRLQVPERAVELVVGVLPDAAGVEHDDIRVLHVDGGHVAVGLEQPGEALGVVLVHLAPEGAHQVPLGHLASVRPVGGGSEVDDAAEASDRTHRARPHCS